MTGWAAGPLIAFDTETTGLDLETARIVTAYLGNGDPAELSWLIDPGVDIPAEATAVHGITTARAHESGIPAGSAIGEIVTALARALSAGGAVVTYNAPYDFTLLDRECRRYRSNSLEHELGGQLSPVIDPLVLDRYADRYRSGGRRLSDACQVYGVPLQTAHDARSDALAALEVARSLAGRYPHLAALSAQEIHRLQVEAAQEQAENFEAYLRRQGNLGRVVDGTWPVKPIPEAPN